MSLAPNFVYIDADVPEGMTLSAWRAAKSNGKRRWSWRTFLKGLIGQGWKL